MTLPLPRKAAYFFFLAFLFAVIFWEMESLVLAFLFSVTILDLFHQFFKTKYKERASRFSSLACFLMAAALLAWAFKDFIELALSRAPLILVTLLPQIKDWTARYGIDALSFENFHDINNSILTALRNNMRSLTQETSLLTGGFFRILGSVFAAMIWFIRSPSENGGEGNDRFFCQVRREWHERAALFMRSFEKIFILQIVMSIINAFLTFAILLFLNFPYLKFLTLATFVLGIIPIVGSAAVYILVVGTALTLSFKLAVFVFALLSFIHAAEYLVNSRMIGSRLDLPVWAVLVSLIIGERVMGLPGLILAPALLNYFLNELRLFPAENSH